MQTTIVIVKLLGVLLGTTTLLSSSSFIQAFTPTLPTLITAYGSKRTTEDHGFEILSSRAGSMRNDDFARIFGKQEASERRTRELAVEYRKPPTTTTTTTTTPPRQNLSHGNNKDDPSDDDDDAEESCDESNNIRPAKGTSRTHQDGVKNPMLVQAVTIKHGTKKWPI